MLASQLNASERERRSLEARSADADGLQARIAELMDELGAARAGTHEQLDGQHRYMRRG